MKTQINRSELLAAVTKCSKAISQKHPVAAARMLVLQFTQAGLTVIGGSNELVITKNVECAAKNAVSLCCPPDTLQAILSSISVESVGFDISDDKLVISGNGVRANVRCLPYADYPFTPPEPKTKLFDMTNEIVDLLKTLFVPFCAKEDIAHPWLQGVMIACKDNRLRLESGNAYRYSFMERPFKHSDFGVVIDKDAIRQFEYGMSLWSSENNSWVIAKNDDGSVATTLYENKYIPLQDYMREDATVYIVDAGELLSAVNLASLVVDRVAKRVQFDVSKDELVVSVPRTALGEFEQKIECEFSGEPLSIGFNFQYLVEFLSAVSGRVRFNSCDVEQQNPATLVTVDGLEGFTHFIVPMRFVDTSAK